MLKLIAHRPKIQLHFQITFRCGYQSASTCRPSTHSHSGAPALLTPPPAQLPWRCTWSPPGWAPPTSTPDFWRVRHLSWKYLASWFSPGSNWLGGWQSWVAPSCWKFRNSGWTWPAPTPYFFASGLRTVPSRPAVPSFASGGSETYWWWSAVECFPPVALRWAGPLRTVYFFRLRPAFLVRIACAWAAEFLLPSNKQYA